MSFCATRMSAQGRPIQSRVEQELGPYSHLLEGNNFNARAFNEWLAGLPESENIEDRRGEDPTREAAWVAAAREPWRGYQHYSDQNWEREQNRRGELMQTLTSGCRGYRAKRKFHCRVRALTRRRVRSGARKRRETCWSRALVANLRAVSH
jgi:hypothetical protein